MEKLTVGDIFKLFIEKALENLASVKVWFFILPFIGSSIIFWYICNSQFAFITTALASISTHPELIANILGQMKIITDTFLAWCTFNATLIGSIIAVREIYKVRRLRSINEADNEEKMAEIKKINV